MPGARRENRGRNAAAANRRALLGAARKHFATDGFAASLTAIARQAGVGQGSLYRHFPDRISLAVAVFDDNVAQLEAFAARPEASLRDVLELLTEQTVASVAFIDMLRASDDDSRLRAILDRVTDALDRKLGGARRDGDVHDSVTAGHLLLAIEMVAALVAKAPAPSRRDLADRAWAMLRPSIFR
ncbi:TetR family transcriptional regulator [Micromonospora pattaloongensis]|uniref:TetR family transcriptional regulator n=1 Tax=Micromonospora pattaloongensis TaxID=405436 RepID=UPI000A3DE22A|nr:TetR family transcriptional regulator [Micromonospora pattaloongensis]